MLIQLSSGQGPAECELAVKLLADSLMKEFDDMEIISSHPAKTKGCYSSVLLKSISDLSFLEGSIQWICQSPYRPNHKRKTGSWTSALFLKKQQSALIMSIVLKDFTVAETAVRM